MPTASRRILIVDDVPEFIRSISTILRPHFEVAVCSSPLRAIRLMKKGDYHLLLTTLIMRELDGFEVIRRVRGGGSSTPIIMITGHGDDSTAVEATRLGASDYLTKPVVPEELIARIRRVLGGNDADQQGPARKISLITRNPAMRLLCSQTSRAAKSSARVLILGETGTGKQLFARMLHEESAFKKGPFVEVNCAAIPSELLESEFFGHERGAFTGATDKRFGRFEEAADGTLFLDEIGELTMGLQSKLLRVLQSGDFTRVGGSRTIHSTARVVAATNRDLEEEVRRGRFRSDLFYRLNVVALKIPPLRERKEDIPILINHFARRFASSPKDIVQFSVEVIRLLSDYSWPGNIRELEHLIEQLCVLQPGQLITPDFVPVRLKEASPSSSTSRDDFSHLPYHQGIARISAGVLQEHHRGSPRQPRRGGPHCGHGPLAFLSQSEELRTLLAAFLPFPSALPENPAERGYVADFSTILLLKRQHLVCRQAPGTEQKTGQPPARDVAQILRRHGAMFTHSGSSLPFSP
ncbi:MAG: sigma-54 dependent transcriptional regulator [Chthoniobacter sp.]